MLWVMAINQVERRPRFASNRPALRHGARNTSWVSSSAASLEPSRRRPSVYTDRPNLAYMIRTASSSPAAIRCMSSCSDSLESGPCWSKAMPPPLGYTAARGCQVCRPDHHYGWDDCGMRRVGAFSVLLASLVFLEVGAVGVLAQESGPAVLSLKLTGVVDPFVASYISRGIDRANGEGDAAVLITIDTPGGLDSSMRSIIQSILASKVPVICYTAPSGARAASAGTFIMLSCPVAAMAPGTNIGAAHPVGVAGAIEQDKVTNDAAAFIRSLS